MEVPKSVSNSVGSPLFCILNILLILALTSYSVINLCSLPLTSVFGKQKKVSQGNICLLTTPGCSDQCMQFLTLESKHHLWFGSTWFPLEGRVFPPWNSGNFGADDPLLLGAVLPIMLSSIDSAHWLHTESRPLQFGPLLLLLLPCGFEGAKCSSVLLY